MSFSQKYSLLTKDAVCPPWEQKELLALPPPELRLLGPGTLGLGFCCLLLPLQLEKRRLILDELGRLTIKVSFLHVYQD